MRVIYEKTILDKIDHEIEEAEAAGLEISRIELSGAEYMQLWRDINRKRWGDPSLDPIDLHAGKCTYKDKYLIMVR